MYMWAAIFVLAVAVIVGFSWECSEIYNIHKYQQVIGTSDHVMQSDSTYATGVTLRGYDLDQNGLIKYTGTGAATFTFDTTANLFLALQAEAGSAFSFTVHNTSASVLTLTVGTGMTCNVASVAATSAVRLTLVFLSPTSCIVTN